MGVANFDVQLNNVVVALPCHVKVVAHDERSGRGGFMRSSSWAFYESNSEDCRKVEKDRLSRGVRRAD
jgi:hypothetical protein